MIFSSKTPRDLNHDPEPYAVRGENNRWRATISQGRFIIDNASVYAPRITATFDPRPEFDHAQHTEPNPILGAFRRDADEMKRERGWTVAMTALSWDRDAFDSFVDMYDLAVLDHARRVLVRLANITKEN